MLKAKKPLTSIDLFTGGGGLALGVSRAGFHHLALVELNPAARQTLDLSRTLVPEMRDWPSVGLDDIRGNEAELSRFEGVDLLSAGPPCQPFSRAGKHRGPLDDRNLFPSTLEVIRRTHPRAVILENVRGLLRPGFAPYVEYLRDQLRLPDVAPKSGETWVEHGRRISTTGQRGTNQSVRYRVSTHVLNAADFGTPQKRVRAFLVALREDVGVEAPSIRPSHSLEALLRAQWVEGDYWLKDHPNASASARRAIQNKLRPNEELLIPGFVDERWRTVRDAIHDLPDPPESLKTIAPANHVSIAGARRYPGHTGSNYDEPAKTVKAGDHGVPGGENMLVCENNTVRYFTVRELARLQDFPDSMSFSGTWGQCVRQIGNATPVNLAKAVSEAVHRLLIED